MRSAKVTPISAATSKTKGKTSVRSTVGAPSQLNQSSRKGKRAWRKNVDIGEVEEGLEEMRAEERVIGTTLQKTQDNDLFQIDVKGDDRVRSTLPRYSKSQLTSTKILSQRSAVPAILSRPNAPSKKRKQVLSREEKERLLKIAKRPRKGPFNSIMDPTEVTPGSVVVELSEAVKASGNYDAWAQESEEEDLQDGLETVKRRRVKPPVSVHPRDIIEVPAIVEPHQGTSYNPPAGAHSELLIKALETEEKRLKDAEKLAEVKMKIEGALREPDVMDISVPPGMTVSAVSPDDEDEQDVEAEQDEDIPRKKMPQRKTKAQRNKAAKLLKEKRLLAERASTKRMLATISGVKLLRKSTAEFMSAREKARIERQLASREKLKKLGLAGQRLGKHKVPEGQVEVQLGEDLSESLRALKPEGNLFRDRFLSLQQRALTEPRVPVIPKNRRTRIIEYEKHAWKRFE